MAAAGQQLESLLRLFILFFIKKVDAQFVEKAPCSAVSLNDCLCQMLQSLVI